MTTQLADRHVVTVSRIKTCLVIIIFRFFFFFGFFFSFSRRKKKKQKLYPFDFPCVTRRRKSFVVKGDAVGRRTRKTFLNFRDYYTRSCVSLENNKKIIAILTL